LKTELLGLWPSSKAWLLLGLVLIGLVPASSSAASTASQQPSSSLIRTCLNGGPAANLIPSNHTIAIVRPIFTSTPYSQYAYASFYGFYKKYLHVAGNITTDLDWLNTSIRSGIGYNSGWGHSGAFYTFLTSTAAENCGISLGKNLFVVDDIQVDRGALLNPDGSPRYSAVVIGHEEYVTQAEFDQFRRYVAAGGRLIAMSSNMFYVKITFNPRTSFETFVVGHGYAYNGHSAWHSGFWPFNKSLSGWFGSTYCCFHRLTFSGGAVKAAYPIGQRLLAYFGGMMGSSYVSHEENAVSNWTQTAVVATFANKSGLVVASYVHRYGKGAVFCYCIFGEDTINNDPPTEYFMLASVSAPIDQQAVQPAGLAAPPSTEALLTLGGILAVAGTATFVAYMLVRHLQPRKVPA
jgi:hypothetical protein